jgi:hypothetical protein
MIRRLTAVLALSAASGMGAAWLCAQQSQHRPVAGETVESRVRDAPVTSGEHLWRVRKNSRRRAHVCSPNLRIVVRCGSLAVRLRVAAPHVTSIDESLWAART